MTEDIELVEKAGTVQTKYATQVTNIPAPTKDPGQRSINLTDLFLTRWTPPWSRPPSLPAYTWRAWVLNQPVAQVCRDTLISYLTGLDWSISARNSDNRQDLDSTVKYYSNLIQNGLNSGVDYSGFLEWICGDLLDIPFGGSCEIGRRYGSPDGRVVWGRLLDGGTMYPTLNKEFPAVQYYQGYTAVPFPYYSIARIYMSPRPEIFREGWGMAPPEKVYFALDLLNRGDKYYANLLLDIPPAGILDLMDMEKSSAESWIASFRDFIGNTTDSWKVPVLYEHNNDIKFIPFGKSPNDIMYDHISMRYAALVASAYGISLNDIGLQTSSRSGETLAGTIRMQKQFRRVGVARLKQKLKYFWEQIIPNNLQWNWVDLDDESNVSMGRARLASITGFNLAVQMGALSPQEVRLQLLEDGLVDVAMADELPPDAKPAEPGGAKPPEHPGALGHGVPPSLGGEGEIRSLITKSNTKEASKVFLNLINKSYPIIYEFLETIGDDNISLYKPMFKSLLFSDGVGINPVLDEIKDKKFIKLKKVSETDIKKMTGKDVKLKELAENLNERLNTGLGGFLAKSVIETLANVMVDIMQKQIDDLNVNEDLYENLFNENENNFDSVSENGENLVDNADTISYDYIVQQVQAQMQKSLPELTSKFIWLELNKILGDK